MNFAIFDDLGCSGIWKSAVHGDVAEFLPTAAESLDDYFSSHCTEQLLRWTKDPVGLLFIHAHGTFSRYSTRQACEGVEILKHIRLSPWLEQLRSWPAIVYSFEPLEDIIRRSPGDLILASEGVTFLHLPEALRAPLNFEEIAKRRAFPTDAGFRHYVASDYKPPDSAHQISNWWGIYEMFSAYSGHRYPEVAEGAFLPNPQIRSFVHSLRIKKARWLDGERQYRTCDAEAFATIQDRLRKLYAHASNKSIVYVDDEGQNGWSDLLQQVLNKDRNSPQCVFSEAAEPDGDTGSLLAIPDKAGQPSLYATSIERIANWVLSREPNLLILDLRLRGGLEADQTPNEASGMDVAREIRKRDRYLPILFFTASNKAETLAVSQSLDIDDYWMKPGLGEHQGFGTREARLVSLTTQLVGLLGPDYSWLQRAGQQLCTMMTSRRKYWWESDVHWASPGCIHRQDRGSNIQRPLPHVKKTVIESLEALLYTIRMILRFQLLFAPSRSVSSTPSSATYGPPAFTSEMLGRSVFNQLGQLVEVVHGLTGDTRVSANGVIGGFFDDTRPICANGCFVFNRADWWAYRLFALRNRFSHGSTPSIPSATQPVIALQDLKEAVSDALAWLTCDRTPPKPIDQSSAERIAQQMVAAPRLARGRLAGNFYPLLNLCRKAPLSDITINGQRVIVSGCSGPLAEDPRFRMQLVSRPEYRLLTAQSDRLLGGS